MQNEGTEPTQAYNPQFYKTTSHCFDCVRTEISCTQQKFRCKHGKRVNFTGKVDMIHEFKV